MTDGPDFREAYRAGRAAVEERRFSWPAFLAACIGVAIGRIIWKRYSLPWFEGAPLETLIILLLTMLGFSIEGRVKPRARDADRS